MALKKILTQKIKNPLGGWFETSYIGKDENGSVLYTHGKLADNNVIENRNISDGEIINRTIGQEAVESKNINWNTIFAEVELTTQNTNNKKYNGTVKIQIPPLKKPSEGI